MLLEQLHWTCVLLCAAQPYVSPPSPMRYSTCGLAHNVSPGRVIAASPPHPLCAVVQSHSGDVVSTLASSTQVAFLYLWVGLVNLIWWFSGKISNTVSFSTVLVALYVYYINCLFIRLNGLVITTCISITFIVNQLNKSETFGKRQCRKSNCWIFF